MCMPLLTLVPLLAIISCPRYKYKYFSWLLVSLQTLFYEYSKQSFIHVYAYIRTFQVVLVVRNLSANAGDVRFMQVQSLGWEDPLEKDMATHSSILAWRITWIEEPGGLQFMGLQRVGHD